ncbi:MAG: DEAD/DEAH box helicase family protein [Succinivibrio sp.]|nr:DEAD/DEAH box helicase family protein [Succinivibrio sp.]
MKLQFKQQSFQSDAAKAVCDVFEGQPYFSALAYTSDLVEGDLQSNLNVGFGNAKIKIDDDTVLGNINKIQDTNQIVKSDEILHCKACKFNLTIEMETGVGKTYTYIKTIYELNKKYGWTKFIVVVPSVAIREGVYSSFNVTQSHFNSHYGKGINFFIYNSKKLDDLKHYVLNDCISVMIINSQAFNAKGKDARRIDMELDAFNSRRPIDVIAQSNPILIIDEPQSVEGRQTKDNLQKFNPLMILRYSATHKKDSIYNMIYRLDAIDAYNKKLVKKIAVKGIQKNGNNAVSCYLYLSSINLSVSKNPTATLEFDVKTTSGTKRVTRVVNEGFDLYQNSKGLEEYRDLIVTSIRGDTNTIEFSNGLVLKDGEVSSKSEEIDFRRIQIRETIRSHIEKESKLFDMGIKTLSLFFIDEVAKYRLYDASGSSCNGDYAKIFEEEYEQYLNNEVFGKSNYSASYIEYLKAITTKQSHAGYFSIDKKGSFKDSSEKGTDGGEADVDTYALIMKDKEKLLDLNPKKSPVRFIFSHSALREGWDNPNVFQICTLKNANSEIRKRQEVGRGLRLCVNQAGVRMDASVLDTDVQNINKLTVIASESYEDFAKGLQNEIAESISNRPVKVTSDLFKDRLCEKVDGSKETISSEMADDIYSDLRDSGYIDKKTKELTDKYHADVAAGNFDVTNDDLKELLPGIKEILSKVYDGKSLMPANERNNNVDVTLNKDNFDKREFQELWSRINQKTRYLVYFDSNDLVKKAIDFINKELMVSKISYTITSGEMSKISSKQSLQSGSDFITNSKRDESRVESSIPSSLKLDLIGKVVSETGLTRKDICSILKGISSEKFEMYKHNPEEFILKVSNIINVQKSVSVVDHITYDLTNSKYDTDIFTDATVKGRLEFNTMNAQKHVFSHVVYDSEGEKKFATELEQHDEVVVYAKLPRGFYINTPVGHYNPDWAVVFKEGTVKHIYFVAETKGCNDTLNLRKVEEAKIKCAEKHFEKICEKINGEKVVYHQVKNFSTLLNIVK